MSAVSNRSIVDHPHTAEVATEHNSTLVFPIPMDMLDAVREQLENGRPRVVAGPGGE